MMVVGVRAVTKEARRIEFEEFAAHLPAYLDDVARENQPVIVEMKGKLFRVEPAERVEPTVPAPGHDAERLRSVLKSTAGGFKGLDRRRLMADLHAGRRASNFA
jgi:hypothetical protein